MWYLQGYLRGDDFVSVEEQGSRPDAAETLYDKLDSLIQEYFKQSFKENGVLEDGDYIASWAIVVNFGNLNRNDGVGSGYSVASMPAKNPPHAVKGLLREGIDWVLEAQDGAFADDEE